MCFFAYSWGWVPPFIGGELWPPWVAGGVIICIHIHARTRAGVMLSGLQRWRVVAVPDHPPGVAGVILPGVMVSPSTRAAEGGRPLGLHGWQLFTRRGWRARWMVAASCRAAVVLLSMGANSGTLQPSGGVGVVAPGRGGRGCTFVRVEGVRGRGCRIVQAFAPCGGISPLNRCEGYLWARFWGVGGCGGAGHICPGLRSGVHAPRP